MHIRSCHLAGQTYVVYQSASNCGDGFYDEACYQFYLVRLLNSLQQCQAKLHAYCLMPSEIFLLITPTTPYAISGLLHSVNAQYERYYRQRFERDNKIWRGVGKCSLIQGAALTIDCQKFIERLPVAEAVVSHPGAFGWSSYCGNAFGLKHRHLSRHLAFQEFLKISENPFRSYRDFIARPFSKPYSDYLTSKLKSGVAPAIRKQALVKPCAKKVSRVCNISPVAGSF